MQKNIFRVGLIVVALILWGHNGYRFFVGFKQADKTPKGTQAATFDISTIINNGKGLPEFKPYRSDSRDPFRNRLTSTPATKRKTKAKAPKASAKLIRPPRLLLLGVISDPAGSMAVIEDAKHNIHFVGVQDSVSGARIESVKKRIVIYSYQKKRFKLVM